MKPKIEHLSLQLGFQYFGYFLCLKTTVLMTDEHQTYLEQLSKGKMKYISIKKWLPFNMCFGQTGLTTTGKECQNFWPSSFHLSKFDLHLKLYFFLVPIDRGLMSSPVNVFGKNLAVAGLITSQILWEMNGKTVKEVCTTLFTFIPHLE